MRPAPITVAARLDKLEARLGEGNAAQAPWVSAVESRLEDLTAKLTTVARQIAELAGRTGSITGKISDTQTAHINAHNHNTKQINALQAAISDVDDHIDALDTRIIRLEEIQADSIYGHDADPGS